MDFIRSGLHERPAHGINGMKAANEGFRIRRRGLTLTACLLAVAALAACSGKKEMRPTSPGTVPVTIAAVVRKSVPLQVTSIGTVEAYSTVQVKAQVNGQVTGVHFTEGQDVNKGDLLFTIDPRPFEADLQKQTATLAKDEAQLTNARAQARRYEELQKQGVVAREQAESVITNAQALEATVNADKAAVDAARLQLQYTKIYAPISGRTGNVGVKAGNLVKANDVPVLVTINQISPIFADFTVPEQTLGDIKRYMTGGKLRVTAQTAGQPPVEGALTFVDNAVDATTGTIHLKATFENNRRLLWPGQFVTTTLTLATQADATVVPSQAVLNGQQGTYVYVAKKDNTAESRGVVVERTNGQETVIRSGLEPGETVITDGQLRLVSGSRLEVKAAYTPPASAAPLPPGAPQDPTSVAARDVPLVSSPPALAPTDNGNSAAQRRPNNKQEAER